MTEEQTLRNFCKDHSINIVDTNKRAHRVHKLSVDYFQVPYDYNIIENKALRSETEALYTIEIAESELKKIANFESQVFNHMKAKGHYDMFNMIMEQKEQEKHLRHKYPAVQKAYEQYSLMLKLAQSGEL